MQYKYLIGSQIMKRKLCLILTLLMLFAVSACAIDDTAEPAETESAPQETVDLSIYEKAEGELVQEVWYNSNGLKFSTVSYEYDGYGRLVKETTLGVNDAPVGYKEYILNDDGLAETMINYVAEGPEEYSEEYRVLYEYNETGLKMKETNVINGETVSGTVYAYEGERLVSEKYYEGEELMNDIAYEYDESGNLVELLRQDMLEDSQTTESFSYENGLLVSKTETDADRNVTSRTEYSYDEYGNELTVSVYGADNVSVSTTKNEYEYDEPGNIIKCTRSQADGQQSTVIEYTWSYVKG